MMHTHSVYSAYKKFLSICKSIESDSNYRDTATSDEKSRNLDDELLSLVRKDDGDSIHTPRKSAIAIIPSLIKAFSIEKETLGITYEIHIAKKGIIDPGDEYPIWHIEETIMLVKKTGAVSFHTVEDAKQNNFTDNLPDKTLDNFLKQECLHPGAKETKSSINNFSK